MFAQEGARESFESSVEAFNLIGLLDAYTAACPEGDKIDATALQALIRAAVAALNKSEQAAARPVPSRKRLKSAP